MKAGWVEVGSGSRWEMDSLHNSFAVFRSSQGEEPADTHSLLFLSSNENHELLIEILNSSVGMGSSQYIGVHIDLPYALFPSASPVCISPALGGTLQLESEVSLYHRVLIWSYVFHILSHLLLISSSSSTISCCREAVLPESIK